MIGSQGSMKEACNLVYLIDGETADGMLVSVPASVSTTIKGMILILSKQLMDRVGSPEAAPSLKLVEPLLCSLNC